MRQKRKYPESFNQYHEKRQCMDLSYFSNPSQYYGINPELFQLRREVSILITKLEQSNKKIKELTRRNDYLQNKTEVFEKRFVKLEKQNHDMDEKLDRILKRIDPFCENPKMKKNKSNSSQMDVSTPSTHSAMSCYG